MEGENKISLEEAFLEAIGEDPSDMKWIETLRQLSGKSLRQFAKDTGTSHGHLGNLMRRDSPGMVKWMTFLCKARKESGLTWNQLGKMWDKRYLDED